VALTHLPLPGPVLGMVILFIGLTLRHSPPTGFVETVRGLLSHLSLLFVPAGVGVTAHLGLLARDGLALGAALIVSTGITIAVTAKLMVWLAPPPRSNGSTEPTL